MNIVVSMCCGQGEQEELYATQEHCSLYAAMVAYSRQPIGSISFLLLTEGGVEWSVNAKEGIIQQTRDCEVRFVEEKGRDLEDYIAGVVAELARASEKFGPFASAHEGYAVILEELDELFDAIKAKDVAQAKREAIQVGAMALRFLVDVKE